VPLSRDAASRTNGNDEIRGRIVAELEQRRLATIKSVTAERNRLRRMRPRTEGSGDCWTNASAHLTEAEKTVECECHKKAVVEKAQEQIEGVHRANVGAIAE
jgi:hypothetical protein